MLKKELLKNLFDKKRKMCDHGFWKDTCEFCRADQIYIVVTNLLSIIIAGLIVTFVFLLMG